MIKHNFRMPRAIFSFIVLLTGFCSGADHRVEIDLRALDSAEPKSVRSISYRGPIIDFLDSQTLVVSFYVNNPSPGLSKREDPRGGYFLFETAIFDTKSGEVLSKHIWGNATPQSSVFPLLDGNMLFRNSQEIAVYSRNYKKLATYTFPAKALVPVRVSSDRRFVYVRERIDKYKEDLKILGSSNLKEIGSFNLPPHFSDIANDSSVAYDEDNKIFVRQDALPEKQLVLDPALAAECRYMRLKFLSLRRHLIFQCKDLLLTDFDGKVLGQMKLQGHVVSGVTESGDGSLLAALTFQLKGGSSWLDTFPHATNFHVVVLESSSLKEMITIPIKSGKREFPAFALSPDGSKLAYVEDGTVKLALIGKSGQAGRNAN